MKTGWLTGILLGTAVVLALVVPPVREGLRTGFYALGLSPSGSFPSAAELERIAQQHPQDPQIWLGYAEALAALSNTGWGRGRRLAQAPPSPVEAYHKAISVAPDSPAINFRCALYHLRWLAYLRPEERFDRSAGPPAPLSASQRSDLHRAQVLLYKSRQLAPDNAAWTTCWLGRTSLSSGIKRPCVYCRQP